MASGLPAIALELCNYRFVMAWTIEETNEQATADATTTATATVSAPAPADPLRG